MSKFCAIMFPPASVIYENITKEIQDRYRILDSYSVYFNDWAEFIYEIYKPDPMPKWKLESKIAILNKYPKQSWVVMFDIPDPTYTPKKGGVICMQAKKFKKIVRKKYARQVQEYKKKGWHKPGLIIHIGDTPEHTVFLESALEKLKEIRQ